MATLSDTAAAPDALLQTGALADSEADAVERRAAEEGRAFDEVAIELGLATTDDVARARRELARTVTALVSVPPSVSDEIVVISDPASPRAEAVRLLRTQIIAQHVGAGRRALAVCAATDGSGVSFVAGNLAAALAQVGIKTLLVDANLRSPRLDSMFGVDPNGPGLSTYLTLQANRPERVIYPNVLPNLSLLTAGPPVARPQELLSGARFKAGVDILLREFDVTIFDTPAANENADALSVAGLVGYALLVARRNHGFTNDVSALARQLAAARATVVGSVLNEYA
jgi:capsular exopolysaccharide synthesis family protein